MLNSHKKNNIGFVRLLNRRKEPVNSEINWHPVKPWHRQVQWQSWNIGVPKKTTSKVVSSVQWCFRGGLSGGYETSFNFWCGFFCLIVCLFWFYALLPWQCFQSTSSNLCFAIVKLAAFIWQVSRVSRADSSDSDRVWHTLFSLVEPSQAKRHSQTDPVGTFSHRGVWQSQEPWAHLFLERSV